jgi:ABC-2 type transport system permease protein
MNAFFALVRKDLILYVADRRALLMHLVLPIVIAAFFGSVFGGSAKNGVIDVALVQQDASEVGRRIAFSGMGVQFILFMGMNMGIAMLAARRDGIWNRLLAAPVSLALVVLARAVSATIIAFCLLCIVFAVAVLAFGVTVSSLPGFLGIALCFGALTAGFGLLVAAFGKTPEAARGITMFTTLIMVMLGGAWVPTFVFPAWVQQATMIVPTRWAITGLDAVTWRGLGLPEAMPAMAALLGFAALFMALAIWRFQKAPA